MKSNHSILLFLVLVLMLVGCSEDSTEPAKISIFSATLNGSDITNGAINIPLNSTLVIVFSNAVKAGDFEKEFSMSPAPVSLDFNYSNQSSRVSISLTLEPQTNYVVEIGNGPIGQAGAKLDGSFVYSFTTINNGVINSQPPCTSTSTDCLQTESFTGSTNGDFDFYSSFPIYEEMAEWQDLEAAIIVVHGANRDADNYFNFLTTTLQAENLSGKVVLLAPHFKNEQEASGNDFYWTNTSWREGNNSLDAASISSFTIVDKLIEQLADQLYFPVLKKVIVTGHSSGALFTHLYAAANKVEKQFPNIDFEYVVANSQYFYYPDGQRINEGNNQLYTPTGCTGYDIYPTGFNIVPPYVSDIGAVDFNEQFISRSITYLLGNGSGADAALNTTDCYATLLGSSRYQRGENMYRYMELVFPGGHNHKKEVVAGIGHNGQGMYQSSEFRSLLQQLLN